MYLRHLIAPSGPEVLVSIRPELGILSKASDFPFRYAITNASPSSSSIDTYMGIWFIVVVPRSALSAILQIFLSYRSDIPSRMSKTFMKYIGMNYVQYLQSHTL